MANFLKSTVFSVCIGSLGGLLGFSILHGCGNSGTNPTPTADLAAVTAQSCCGKPGDTGNSKGVGKYCTDPTGVECRGNSLATVCSVIGDSPGRKTTFCTVQCDPAVNGFCGENASCTYDTINKAYGCTPDACTKNLPAGCTL